MDTICPTNLPNSSASSMWVNGRVYRPANFASSSAVASIGLGAVWSTRPGFRCQWVKLPPVYSALLALEQEIDPLVYELYGLTNEKIGIVEGK